MSVNFSLTSVAQAWRTLSKRSKHVSMSTTKASTQLRLRNWLTPNLLETPFVSSSHAVSWASWWIKSIRSRSWLTSVVFRLSGLEVWTATVPALKYATFILLTTVVSVRLRHLKVLISVWLILFQLIPESTSSASLKHLTVKLFVVKFPTKLSSWLPTKKKSLRSLRPTLNSTKIADSKAKLPYVSATIFLKWNLRTSTTWTFHLNRWFQLLQPWFLSLNTTTLTELWWVRTCNVKVCLLWLPRLLT